MVPRDYHTKQEYIELSDGSMYIVKEVLAISFFKGDEDFVKEWRDYKGYEKIFKRESEGYYYLCDKVDDAEIIEP